MARLTVASAAAVSTVVIGGGILLALRSSLHAVLWELCVLEHRARFWMRACMLELVGGIALATTVGVSTLGPVSRDGIAAIAAVLRWQLAGGVAGVVVMAVVVARESARYTRLGPPDCAEGEDAWTGSGKPGTARAC